MKGFIRILYQVSLLLQVCWGAHAWFTWGWDFLDNIPRFVIYSIFAFIAFAYKFSNKSSKPLSLRVLAILFCMFIAVSVHTTTINGLIYNVMYVLPFYVLLTDNSSYNYLEFISIALAIVVFVGLILHVLFLFGLQFPGVPIRYGESRMVADNYVFSNYFVLLNTVPFNGRFHSVFLEPSYLGTMIAFILYGNHFDMKKKYNVILVAALIASLSLAGYITAIVGYILNMGPKGNKIAKRLIGISTVLLIGYFFAVSYNGGNNLLNEGFYERLQLTNDEQIIKGNNRVFEETQIMYDHFIQNENIWFGTNRDNLDTIGGAGYMVYLLVYGLFPALLWLIVYLLIGFSCKNRRRGLIMVLLVIITFIQAAYPASYAWLIPVILAVRSNNYSPLY